MITCMIQIFVHFVANFKNIQKRLDFQILFTYNHEYIETHKLTHIKTYKHKFIYVYNLNINKLIQENKCVKYKYLDAKFTNTQK